MMENLLENLFQSTELHDAVADGDVERVRQLLKAGANVNARAFYDNTPLMDACGGGMAVARQGMKQARQQRKEQAGEQEISRPPDAAELLKNMPRLDSKEILAQMNRKCEYDDALPQDDATIAQILLQNGADVNAVDKGGQSALMIAVRAGRVETARVLLEHGADIWAQDDEHLTALMLAAQSRRLEAVRLLLENGADADYRTPKGSTTLMAAAEGGRVEVAKLLMARGQDVNTVGVNGQTALLIAALKEHEEMIAFLKTSGANIGFLEAVALGELEGAQSLPTPAPTERGPEWGHSLLFWAVKMGRVEAVRLLLERGINPNAAKKSGQSVLLSAVMRDDVECARLLLDAGADPNGAAEEYSTPLGLAAKQDYTAMMELLLERGANVNKQAGGGNTTLSGAVMFGNYDAAKRLLEAGADPNEKDNEKPEGMSLLTFATARNDKRMVQLLLDHGASPKRKEGGLSPVTVAYGKPEIAAILKQAAGTDLHEQAKAGKTEELLAQLDAGTDINVLGEHGETLLIAALRGEQTELARILIKRGIDIHVNDKPGQTALLCAAQRGDADTMRLLLERGADVTITDSFGKTVLLNAVLGGKTEAVTLLLDAGAKLGPIEAAVLGELETVRMLLNAGADVDTRNLAGMTPLMGAAAGGHNDILTALLIRGADINAVDEQGQTALTYAVTRKHLEAVRLLLEQGADVNLSGLDQHHIRRVAEIIQRHNPAESDWRKKEMQRRGSTPLCMAALHNVTEIAALLLEHGANINAPYGIAGHTPLASAAMVGHADMVRFLLERGADLTIKDDHGHTALQSAEQLGKNPEVVEILKAAAKKS